jgi:cell division protein FtsQ
LEISGSEKISSEEVVKILNISPQKNIFKIKTANLKKILEKNPWIKKVDIEKIFPSSLFFRIKERKEKVVISSRDNFFLADEEGVILEKIDRNFVSLPVVTGFNYNLKPGDIIKDKEFLKIIECVRYSSYLPAGLVKIKISDKKKFFLYLKNGLELRLGDPEKIEEKLKIVPYLLETAEKERISLTYLDLQAENYPAGGIKNEKN